MIPYLLFLNISALLGVLKYAGVQRLLRFELMD